MQIRNLPIPARNFLVAAALAFGVLWAGAAAQPPPPAPAPARRVMSAQPATVAATALPPAPVYDYKNPPQGVFDDEWLEIFMGGQKVGFGHETYRREGDHIFTEEHDELRLKRLSSLLTVSNDSSSEETLNGVIVSFHSVSNQGDQPTIVDGHGDGKAFDITMQVGDYHADPKHVEFPAGTLMTWGVERLMRGKDLAPGNTFDYAFYGPDDDAYTPLTTKITVGAREKVTIRGQEVEAVRLTSHVSSKSGLGGIDSVEWMDAADRTLKATVPLGPMSMDMVISTKAQALADYLPSDIFTASLLTLNRSLPADATAVVLNLKRADGQPLPPLPESAMEHGEVLPDGSVRLTLTRPELARKNAAAAPGPALADPAPFLARNAYLDTSDPLVRSLATQAGGPPATDPVTVAWQLRDFVSDYINKKDYNVGFGTATDTAKSREGDCTEHAVLLAALGRARGLPTRTVSGLVYIPRYQGQDNILGFHMWTQFYFDGRWEDFDAALTDGAEPYWRLGLVASDLDEGSLSDFTMELARWMSEMKITVESVATAAGK